MTDETKLQKWGQGPWVDEPDRLEFEAYGLPCLMRRNMQLGNWCGYVAVPPGHPLHGANYNDARAEGIYAHGGITYTDGCQGEICHAANAGEADDVWWFGFDAGHAGDLVPQLLKYGSLAEFDPELHEKLKSLGDEVGVMMHDVYRDEAYMRAQCEQLAAQLMAAAEARP